MKSHEVVGGGVQTLVGQMADSFFEDGYDITVISLFGKHTNRNIQI